MDRRSCEVNEDYFNALIGSISAQPLHDLQDTTLHPAEYFMRLCETKGDFSFIYSSAPRSSILGRSWRPMAGAIPAIQPWHTFGDGQSGHLYPTFLRLNNMYRLSRGPISSIADEFLRDWLRKSCGDSASGNIQSRILLQLQHIGFAGCGDVIELTEGYFFPLTRNRIADDPSVFVAVSLRWTHGGPGLITTQGEGGLHQFRDVGIFVGPHPKSGAPINLG